MCLNLPVGFCVSSSQVRYSSDIIQLDVISCVIGRITGDMMHDINMLSRIHVLHSIDGLSDV